MLTYVQSAFLSPAATLAKAYPVLLAFEAACLLIRFTEITSLANNDSNVSITFSSTSELLLDISV